MKCLSALAAAVVLAVVAVPALAATRTVNVADNVFAPKSLTVAKGTTVRFRWTGKAPHNVAVATGPVKFRSTTQKSGTYSKRLTRAGTYKLVCNVHPGMAMTLRVK
jgi:plastocyanin